MRQWLNRVYKVKYRSISQHLESFNALQFVWIFSQSSFAAHCNSGSQPNLQPLPLFFLVWIVLWGRLLQQGIFFKSASNLALQQSFLSNTICSPFCSCNAISSSVILRSLVSRFGTNLETLNINSPCSVGDVREPQPAFAITPLIRPAV